MHYTWTFFWVFLLIHMTTYVVSSMGGAAYDFIAGYDYISSRYYFNLYCSRYHS